MAAPAGLEQRHRKGCTGNDRCGCLWRAFVYSARDRKLIRKTFASKAEAKGWRQDKLTAVKRGELRAPTSKTVREAGEEFMVGAADGTIPTTSGGRYKPATLRGYRVALDKRIYPVFGARRLSDVHRGDVQELADRLTAEGFSASTVHNTLDLQGRVIHVQRGWDAIEGAQAPKSDAAVRNVPILEPLAVELTAHRARTGRAGDALVFGRTATAPFNPETVRRDALAAWGWREVPNPDPDARPRVLLIKTREDALKPITLHEARHTCASLLIAAGVNAKALSTIMGHSTIAMTFDTYGHLLPGGLDEARAAADAYIAADAPRLRLVS